MPTRTRSNGNGSTAVATREANVPAERQQHPLVVALEERMPAIAEMLPEGMDAKRFRRVVVQALARNPELLQCSPLSVITAITEAAEAGLEPTGVLGRAWLIPYSGKAQLIIGYRGFAELAWRADRVLLTTDVVRDGDAFSYQRGTAAFLHHTPSDEPDREADDSNITHAYCLARFPDGREDFEVMSLAALLRIRDRTRRRNPVWDSDLGEMAKKTPLRRLLKRLPLSPSVQRFLAGDEAVDFDTPVECVAADQVRRLPAGASRTSQASARAAALAGDVDDEPDPPTEPEPEQEPEPPRRQARRQPAEQEPPAEQEMDVDDIPFEPTAEASTTSEPVNESPAPRGASAVTCPHPAAARAADAGGVVCSDCGTRLAYRDEADEPEQVHKARAPREALMARIHVGRTHEDAKALTARVLGLDPNEQWSMAELLEDELQAVVDAIRDEDQRGQRAPRRQPAAAGRRSR